MLLTLLVNFSQRTEGGTSASICTLGSMHPRCGVKDNRQGENGSW